MTTKMFVNLPVKDLKKATSFYEALGFRLNPDFSDDNAACIVISEHNYAMLLSRDYFKTFTNKPVADAHKSIAVLIALTLDSKEAVDAMAASAVAHGGKEPQPAQDLGFMFKRTFEDPDGHTWEPVWMDASAMQ